MYQYFIMSSECSVLYCRGELQKNAPIFQLNGRHLLGLLLTYRHTESMWLLFTSAMDLLSVASTLTEPVQISRLLDIIYLSDVFGSGLPDAEVL